MKDVPAGEPARATASGANPARRRPRSLRGHLARLLLPPLAAMLLVGATGAYFFAIAPATEAYDYGLVDAAHAIASRVHMEQGRVKVDLPAVAEQVVRADKYDMVYFAVRDPAGLLLAGDGGIPPPPKDAVQRDDVILYDAAYWDEPVRVAIFFMPCGELRCAITVAETTVKRATLKRDILFGSVLPQGLLAFLTVALLVWGLTRGLEPLEVLSEEIRARSPNDLRPIDLSIEPEEVRPLLVALNQLFEEVAESTRSQQRFLANAAHQLRTPLAGLQAHTEVALSLPAPDACRAELEQIHQGTVRTARLANQLLALARAEGGAHRGAVFGTVELRQVAEEGANEWVHEALRRGIDLGFELQASEVHGDALLLREALANLVHNALEYTPAGGRVTVRSAPGSAGAGALLEVEDDGPGIPVDERSRVLERFYRTPGTAGVGSGLGLAIVREIMQMHGGSIEIRDAVDTPQPAGCLIRLRFPPEGRKSSLQA
jgi:two-component system sensor histidine kinase TctE